MKPTALPKPFSDYSENEALATQIQASQSAFDIDADFFDSLGAYAQSHTFEAGETILEQGQFNDTLFFLVDGMASVLVGGERVSVLGQRGDLIGEMSVITKNPVSATIVAQTPVRLIGISTSRLEQLEPKTAERFANFMNQVYATILTEKLLTTNDKAKKFETANRELLAAQKQLEEANLKLEERVEQRTAELLEKTRELYQSNQQLESQKALLQTSFRKLEELAGTKTLTFSKLTGLYHQALVPLQKTIGALQALADPNGAKSAPPSPLKWREALEQAATATAQALQVLQPMTALYSQERAMQSKNILFLDPEKKHQMVARLALGGTGAQLDVASQIDEAKAFMAAKSYDIVFVDASLLQASAELHRKTPQAHLVLMTSGEAAQVVGLPEQRKLFSTVVSRDENDRVFTIKSIMTTAQKLISQDLFGIEKYLAWGAEVRSHTVSSSDQRADLNDQMQAYLKGMGVRASILGRCQVVAEELLMNAIYDAPVDGEGRSLYNHLPRTEKVILKDNEQAQFRYACDGMLAAISVADPFGAFRADILYSYLEACYSGKSANEGQRKGGAGRGLHQIVENSDLVIFNVTPQMRTEVVALFNLDTARGELARGPSFHFFSSPTKN